MTKIASICLLTSALIVGLVVSTWAKDNDKGKASQLDLLKQLAGEWQGKAAHGELTHEATVTYKVTSGGSTVVETLDPGGEHEMVTVFCQDGDDLVLTHYCMLGNQPRMKAEKSKDAKKLVFKFTGAGNLKSERDPHMHDLMIEFLSDDHIKTTWTFYKDGKADATATFDLKRKKK